MITKEQFQEWLKRHTKWSIVNFFEDTPCLEFQGKLNCSYKYAAFQFEFKRYIAHRLVLYFLNGKWPHVSDHKCRNTCCLNELHLQDTNYSVNTANKPKITHCRRGHEFTPENTRLTTTGSRQCKACVRQNSNVMQPIRRMEKKLGK